MQANFDNLPSEMIWEIFSHLDKKDIESFLSVNPRMAIIACDFLTNKILHEKPTASGDRLDQLTIDQLHYANLKNRIIKKIPATEITVLEMLDLQYRMNLAQQTRNDNLAEKINHKLNNIKSIYL